jgi:hypothetical protein
MVKSRSHPDQSVPFDFLDHWTRAESKVVATIRLLFALGAMPNPARFVKHVDIAGLDASFRCLGYDETPTQLESFGELPFTRALAREGRKF